jgi:hypothetical protein
MTWFTGLPLSAFTLKPGQQINYSDIYLAMQQDANFVLYQNGKPLWSSQTNGKADCSKVSCQATFSNGNLVVYAGSQVLFQTNTAGSNDLKLIFSKSVPYLTIKNSRGTLIWSER